MSNVCGGGGGIFFFFFAISFLSRLTFTAKAQVWGEFAAKITVLFEAPFLGWTQQQQHQITCRKRLTCVSTRATPGAAEML